MGFLHHVPRLLPAARSRPITGNAEKKMGDAGAKVEPTTHLGQPAVPITLLNLVVAAQGEDVVGQCINGGDVATTLLTPTKVTMATSNARTLAVGDAVPPAAAGDAALA